MMFAQANSEHCRHKMFNAEFDRSTAARSDSLFEMIRNTHARTPAGHAVGLSRQRRSDRGHAGDALVPRSGKRHLSRQRRADRHPDQSRDAQSPDRDLAVPGRGHRRRGRDPRRRGDRPRRQTQGGPGGFLGVAPAHSRNCRSHGSAVIGKPARIASALEIMLEGADRCRRVQQRIRPARHLRLFPHASKPRCRGCRGRVRGYHKPIMLAGGLGNVRREQVEKSEVSVGAQH